MIERYGCDAIIETGCNMGDTTAYFSRRYAGLPVITCDIKPEYVEATRNNVTVEETGSPRLIERYAGEFRCPYFYLDAHWYQDWPLERELAAIHKGIVTIDASTSATRASVSMNTTACVAAWTCWRVSATSLRATTPSIPAPSTNFPCQQVAHRGGRAYVPINQAQDYPRYCNYCGRHELDASADQTPR